MNRKSGSRVSAIRITGTHCYSDNLFPDNHDLITGYSDKLF